MLPAHMPLWQSRFVLQLLPNAHLGQVPPQSTSDSVPFFTPSLQEDAIQMLLMHVPL